MSISVAFKSFKTYPSEVIPRNIFFLYLYWKDLIAQVDRARRVNELNRENVS